MDIDPDEMTPLMPPDDPDPDGGETRNPFPTLPGVDDEGGEKIGLAALRPRGTRGARPRKPAPVAETSFFVRPCYWESDGDQPCYWEVIH